MSSAISMPRVSSDPIFCSGILHIGMFSPTWPPQQACNGIVTYVDTMRSALGELGHRVTVLAGSGDSCGDERVVVVPVPNRRLWHRLRDRLGGIRRSPDEDDPGQRIANTANAIHARIPFDCFEIEESFGWFSRVQESMQVPVVVKLHGPAFLSHSDGDEAKLATLRAVDEGSALRASQTIVAPSASTLRETVEHYRLKAPVLRHVGNPVLPVDEATLLWRPNESPTLLFIGRFDRHKGADLLLAAFVRVRARHSSSELVIVGADTGLTDDAGRCEHFEAYVARRLSPEDRAHVRFLGPKTPDEVRRLRVHSRCVLVSSRRESYGYAAAEALAQGCPLVAFDVAGVNELVRHGETGLLARAGDVADFADKVCLLLENVYLASSLGAAGRLEMLRQHSPISAARRMVDVYREAIAAHVTRQ